MRDDNFGAYLRELRLARGYGLRSFAKRVGFLASNLSYIETGQANPPRSSEILSKIAKGLGLTENSVEWTKLFDLAAKPGEPAADVHDYFEKIDAVDELPLMARTIKNKKLTKQQIQSLIRGLKRN